MGRKKGGAQGETRGRLLFRITAFNLAQVVKLADNSDSFTGGLGWGKRHTTGAREFSPPSAWRYEGEASESKDGRRGRGREKETARREEAGGGGRRRARASITLSCWRDSLLTSETRGSPRRRRLGPAGNWWSAPCHGKHVSTHWTGRDGPWSRRQ